MKTYIWSDILGNEQSANDTYIEILQYPGEELVNKIAYVISGLYSEYDYNMLLETNPSLLEDVTNSLLYDLNV